MLKCLLINPNMFTCNVLSVPSSDDICFIEENMKPPHEEVGALHCNPGCEAMILSRIKKKFNSSGMMRYKCVTAMIIVIMFNHVRSHLSPIMMIIDDVMTGQATDVILSCNITTNCSKPHTVYPARDLTPAIAPAHKTCFTSFRNCFNWENCNVRAC